MRSTPLVIVVALSCGTTPSDVERLPRAAAMAKGEAKSDVNAETTPMTEHALLIRIPISDGFGTELELERVHALEDELTEGVSAARVGEVDGHEFGGGEAVLFLYGPDADALYSTVEPLLRKSEIARGAEVIRRYGPASDPKAREATTKL